MSTNEDPQDQQEEPRLASQPTEPTTPGEPRVRRVADRLVPMIEDSLSRLSNGEEVWWDINFFPSPDGSAVLCAMFWVPSGVMGLYYNHVAFWTPMGHTQQAVDGSVREALESLWDARSKALAEKHIETNGGTNGQGLPGLIVPPGV